MEIPQEQPLVEIVKITYAANVNEDWVRLEKMLEHAQQEGSDLVVMTQLLSNPLTREDQSAYAHAYRYVSDDYNKHKVFSDLTNTSPHLPMIPRLTS